MIPVEVRKELDELSQIIKVAKESRMSEKEIYKYTYKAVWNLCKYLYDFDGMEAFGEMSDFRIREKKETQLPALINASIIPLSQYDDNFINDFTKWATLYSEFVVFALPVKFEYLGISYSYQGEPAESNIPQIKKLLSYNISHEILINSGKVVFLPIENYDGYTSMSDHYHHTYRAPLLQEPDKWIFTPLNSKDRIFTCQSYQDFIIYKKIIIPYFRGIELSDLIKIADNETDAFRKFNYLLKNKLINIAKVDSFEKLQDILQEIDYEVTNLQLEMEKLSKLRVLQNIDIAFFTLSLGALIFSNDELLRQIAGVAGSVNLLDLFKEAISYEREVLDIKKSDLYLPYLLKQKIKINET